MRVCVWSRFQIQHVLETAYVCALLHTLPFLDVLVWFCWLPAPFVFSPNLETPPYEWAPAHGLGCADTCAGSKFGYVPFYPGKGKTGICSTVIEKIVYTGTNFDVGPAAAKTHQCMVNLVVAGGGQRDVCVLFVFLVFWSTFVFVCSLFSAPKWGVQLPVR